MPCLPTCVTFSTKSCRMQLQKESLPDGRTCPCPSNAGGEPRPEAGARDERTLEAVRCKPWLGAGSGTGHRLAAPRVHHPFRPPRDQGVGETLAWALF